MFAKRNTRAQLLVLLILLPGFNVATAAELVPGTEYQSATKIYVPDSGIHFTVPANWIGGMPVGGAAFVFGSHSQAGIGLMIMRDQARLEDLQGLLGTQQDLGDGVVLLPTSPLRKQGNRVSAEYGNGIYYGYAVGEISVHGNGAVAFFSGPRQQSKQYQSLAEQVMKSVRFEKPKVSASQQQWLALLKGMMLKRMSSYYSGGVDGAYVGGSSSQTLHLCSNGQYRYHASSDVSVDAGTGSGYGASGYGADGNQDAGTWQVSMIGMQANLVLRSQDGSQSLHAITLQNGETYLDGERAYRVQSDSCR